MADKHLWSAPIDCSIHPRLLDSEFKDVIDCDGDVLFSVPDSWTDEQIWLCLKIANNAHDIGFQRGEYSKIHDIKKVLDLL